VLWSAGLGSLVAGVPLPAGVGFEGGGSEGFELGEQFVEPAVVADPGLVVVVLVGAEPAADCFRSDLAGPFAIGVVYACLYVLANDVHAVAADLWLRPEEAAVESFAAR